MEIKWQDTTQLVVDRRDAVCHTYDKVGHWAKWCRTGKQANKQSAAATGGEQNHSSDDKSAASAIFRPNLL